MDIYKDLMNRYKTIMLNADSRLDSYPLMYSPMPTIILTLTYLFLVLFALPKIMKHRKEFDLKSIMLFYNFTMVSLSAYLFIQFGINGWFTHYSFGCQPVDYSNSPLALKMVSVCYIFYISKFIELLDTIFFLLRKKTSQVSVLHVLHHGIMPISWYIGVKFVPGGFGTFHALLNSAIHFMMYTYYGMSALGPKYKKYLWWKKHMTLMQMIQFVLVATHCTRQLFVGECNYPVSYAYWIGSYAWTFLIMFGNFYRQAYIKNTKLLANSTHSNGHLTNGKVNGNGHLLSNGNGHIKSN